jgi:hypothetical protein
MIEVVLSIEPNPTDRIIQSVTVRLEVPAGVLPGPVIHHLVHVAALQCVFLAAGPCFFICLFSSFSSSSLFLLLPNW